MGLFETETLCLEKTHEESLWRFGNAVPSARSVRQSPCKMFDGQCLCWETLSIKKVTGASYIGAIRTGSGSISTLFPPSKFKTVIREGKMEEKVKNDRVIKGTQHGCIKNLVGKELPAGTEEFT